MKFEVSDNAVARANLFIIKHKELHAGKYGGAIGGMITFSFTSTSIGEIQNVECYCGMSECINADEV